MAANKFATMLQKNTHKITVILIYAVLEWVLIFLLLLNSLFSFLIAKFANYFGLKPPCLWCSRVDHILEPNKNRSSYRDLVCEEHATEISKLAICPNHKKLAESQNLCEDCLSSRPKHIEKSTEISRKVAFFTWVSENRIENGERNSRCSCCDESFSSKIYPSYLLLKPSWGVLDYSQKQSLITESKDDNNNEGKYSDIYKSEIPADHDNDCDNEQKKEEEDDERVEDEGQIVSDVESFSSGAAVEEDCSRSVSNFHDVKEGNGDEKACPETQEHESSHTDDDGTMIQICCGEDESLKLMNLPLHDKNPGVFDRLVPVELIDSSTIASQRSFTRREEDLAGRHDHGNFNSEQQIEPQVNLIEEVKCVSEEAASSTMNNSAEKTSCGMEKSLEIGETQNSSIQMVELQTQDLAARTCEQLVVTQVAQTPCNGDYNVEPAAVKDPAGEESGCKLLSDDSKSEILIGMEVSDHEPAYQSQAKEPIPSLPFLQVDQPSMSSENIGISISLDASIVKNDQGLKQLEKGTIQERTSLAGRNHEGINHHLSLHSESNEVEDEKFPDTLTYMDGLHHLHKKLLLFEKRESGTEESWDGSVISEMEGGDGAFTIERLKSALKSERKALSALYAELEEERSAAAIAANQTMAMITRLQEEKAAMQMEALQYQRMMEEQSEYDQEALQLLNELMIKREKEKQELEKELEMYRKKVLDYEAKEKMVIVRKRDGSVRSRGSSASCSNAEDNDELSIDLNREGRDEDSSFYGHQESSNNNMPADAVQNLEEMGLDCVKHLSTLDESLAEFEEERLSILEELKALEEKLFTLGDDEEQLFEDARPIDHFADDYCKEFSESFDFSSPDENEVSNVFSEVLNGKHCPDNKIMASKARRLLPLFDETSIITEEGELNGENIKSDSTKNGIQNSLVSTFELENKKLAIEEEVDHVYERLQALEADREFLKHCIRSLKKGDKGMDLLQEILQHLRDLRTVELRVRNMGDDPLL